MFWVNSDVTKSHQYQQYPIFSQGFWSDGILLCPKKILSCWHNWYCNAVWCSFTLIASIHHGVLRLFSLDLGMSESVRHVIGSCKRKMSWETTLIFQRQLCLLCPLPHSATLPALLEVLQEISVGGRTSRDHSKSLDGPKWRACPSNYTVVSDISVWRSLHPVRSCTPVYFLCIWCVYVYCICGSYAFIIVYLCMTLFDLIWHRMLDNLICTSCASSSLLPKCHQVSIERCVQMHYAEHLGNFEFIGIHTVW